MNKTWLAEVEKKVDILWGTLRCTICLNVFVDPVIFRTCGDMFCRNCAMDYFGKKCPTCNKPIEERDVLDDKPLREFIPHIKHLKMLLSGNNVDETIIKETNGLDDTDKAASEEEKKEESKLCEEDNGEKEEEEMEIEKVEIAVKDETPKRVSVRLSKMNKQEMCKDPDGGEDLNDSGLNQKQKNSVMFTPNKYMTKKPFKSPSYSYKRSLMRFSPKRKPMSPTQIYKLMSPLNVERKNVKGETLLHAAVIRGNVERVTSLLQKKANPNVKDNAGWTPLHEASNHGYFEIAKLLVENGASIDEPGQDGITPLHDAVLNNHMHIANYLASKGGNIYAVTGKNNNVLDLCQNEAAKHCLEKSHRLSADDSKIQVCEEEEKEEKFAFACTSLNSKQKEMLEKCAEMLNAEVLDEFSSEVTHIITSCDDNGQCNRTLKILLGIQTGKWILNADWLELCLEQKKKASEEAFEVPGTKQVPNTYGAQLARMNFVKKQPGLFDGCSFYIYGPINSPSPPKESLNQLIQLGGGKVLLREPRPEIVEQEDHVVPFHAVGTPLSEASHFILYQDKPPRNQEIRANHIFTVTIRWFIECICAFKLIDPNAKK